MPLLSAFVAAAPQRTWTRPPPANVSLPVCLPQFPGTNSSRPTHHHRAKENFHRRPRLLLSFSSFLLHIEQRKTINVHVPLTLTMARGSGLTALDAHDCNYTGD